MNLSLVWPVQLDVVEVVIPPLGGKVEMFWLEIFGGTVTLSIFTWTHLTETSHQVLDGLFRYEDIHNLQPVTQILACMHSGGSCAYAQCHRV